MIIEELYQLFLKHGKVFTDSRKANEGGLFFALKGDHFDGNDFAIKAISDGASYAIVDRPELKGQLGCILVPNVLFTLQLLASYHRKQLAKPIIAITGTNGKTTTKELTASVLKQKFNVWATLGNLNNHIGVPLTLLSMNSDHDIGIIEMGANHPGEIKALCEIAEPDFGLITNVGKAHLEGFGSFEGVIKTKGELYDYIAKNGKGIFRNSDNEYLSPIAPSNVENFTYGILSGTAQLKGKVASNDNYLVAEILFPKGWLYMKSKLTGNYNLENILAAARIGHYFNIDPLKIQKGIEEYIPQNNRSQLQKFGDNTVLLDCYNANPSSMEVSIQNFLQLEKPNKVLVLGDMLELGVLSPNEHQNIVDLVSDGNINEVYLVGRNFGNTITPNYFSKFENADQLKEYISAVKWSGKFLFIKGSRGIQLERILEAL